MIIGVFDSGVGGKSVADAVSSAFPEDKVLYAQDSKNIPYGNKTPEELTGLVVPILQSMVDDECSVIVIACNTVTTTIIENLRSQFNVPLIGVEPMIKVAAEKTDSSIIAVCATPTTLASKRYEYLVSEFARGLQIIEPDCSDWALMIEQKEVDHDRIRKQIVDVCQRGADVIVLGCTHYHWIEEEILDIAKEYKAQVIQPEQAIIRELRRVTGQLR